MKRSRSSEQLTQAYNVRRREYKPSVAPWDREPTIQCGICMRKIYHMTEAIYHLTASHLRLKPYSCKHCGMALYDRQSLEVHVGMHHPPPKGVACYRCKRKFKTRAGLKRHWVGNTKNNGTNGFITRWAQCHQRIGPRRERKLRSSVLMKAIRKLKPKIRRDSELNPDWNLILSKLSTKRKP